MVDSILTQFAIALFVLLIVAIGRMPPSPPRPNGGL